MDDNIYKLALDVALATFIHVGEDQDIEALHGWLMSFSDQSENLAIAMQPMTSKPKDFAFHWPVSRLLDEVQDLINRIEEELCSKCLQK